MGEREVIIAIEKQGSLYFLLNAFIGCANRAIDVWQRSYDRRTAVMAAQNKESADLDQLDDQIIKADRELK